MRRLPLRLAVAVATATTAVMVLIAADRPRVDIATAISAESERVTPAARAGETVRYDDDDVVLLASYALDRGQLAEFDQLSAPQQAAWLAVRAVMPAPDLQRIRQLNIISDGTGGTLGMVHRSTANHDQWILSIDPAESADALRRTIVHELAHMHTLGAADVWKTRSCSGLMLSIGCVRPDSAVGRWAVEFWSGQPEPARYQSDRFVTEYAASSVHEDLAETFMVWVLSDRAARPGIEAKYAALATDAALVELRAQIRARLNIA